MRVFIPARMTKVLGHDLILEWSARAKRAFGAGEDVETRRFEMRALERTLTTLQQFHDTGVDPVHIDVEYECVATILSRWLPPQCLPFTQLPAEWPEI